MDEEKTIEEMKRLMAEVYKEGFNIYQCLNKLKKELKLTEDFPPQAVIWTCESYLRIKAPIQSHYPWFVRAFSESSRRYFFERNQKNDETYKKEARGGMAQSLKDILKGL